METCEWAAEGSRDGAGTGAGRVWGAFSSPPGLDTDPQRDIQLPRKRQLHHWPRLGDSCLGTWLVLTGIAVGRRVIWQAGAVPTRLGRKRRALEGTRWSPPSLRWVCRHGPALGSSLGGDAPSPGTGTGRSPEILGEDQTSAERETPFECPPAPPQRPASPGTELGALGNVHGAAKTLGLV